MKYVLSIMILAVCSFSILMSTTFSNANAQNFNPFTVAAVGDISCKDNGQQTISSIANSNPNLVVFLGDLSYASSLDCFFGQTQMLENNNSNGNGNNNSYNNTAATAVMVTIGNHDIGNGDGNQLTKNQIMTHYNIPKEGYYSRTFNFDGNQILVVSLNYTGFEQNPRYAEDKSILENQQYNFVKNTLENSNAKYKIVISHAPFVSVNCSAIVKVVTRSACHSSLENWDKPLFNKYQSLFKNTGVNLVLAGHNHNYQREVKDGITYIVSGLGGRSHYNIVNENNSHFADDYGFLQLKFYNNSIEGQFISNDGVTVRDQFQLGKS